MTDLVGAIGVNPDQFHVLTIDDRPKRSTRDVAGGPLDNTKWHCVLPRDGNFGGLREILYTFRYCFRQLRAMASGDSGVTKIRASIAGPRSNCPCQRGIDAGRSGTNAGKRRRASSAPHAKTS